MDCKSQFFFPSSSDLEERNSLVSVAKSTNILNQYQDQIYKENQFIRSSYSMRSEQCLHPHIENVDAVIQNDKNFNLIKSNKILRSDQSLEIERLNSVFEREMLESITINLKRVQLKLGNDSRNDLLSISDADEYYESSQREELQGSLNEFNVNYYFQQQNDFENEKLDEMLENSNENQLQQDRCSICLNSYNESEQVRVLKCKHFYHSHCIRVWLQRDKRCPLCKSTVKKNFQEYF